MSSLPVPSHFNSETVKDVWKVSYETLATSGKAWAIEHQITASSTDTNKIGLVLVDVQNTFCVPEFELYVGGRSGTGAVDDNRRLCEFIYRNLAKITQIIPTMDTHQAMQIFHSIFFVNEYGEHPPPFTLITSDDIAEGKWRFNEALTSHIDEDAQKVNAHLAHYTGQLSGSGKYDLTIWPYHAMLGSIGHALVPAVEEAIFFHTITRNSQPDIQIKGQHPLTENYSVLGPEVGTDASRKTLVGKNDALLKKLFEFDAIIIAGQAKSHCVAWTVADLLESINQVDPEIAGKVYLLEDCSSPVVIPGVIDYTDDAEAAYQRFQEAGMHLLKSTEPLENWPGM